MSTLCCMVSHSWYYRCIDDFGAITPVIFCSVMCLINIWLQIVLFFLQKVPVLCVSAVHEVDMEEIGERQLTSVAGMCHDKDKDNFPK